MVFIVGLGNPGPEYAKTRHNVGWILLDHLAASLKAPPFTFQKKFQAEMSKVGPYVLIKPQTFMNESGQAVRAVLDFYGQIAAQPDAEYQQLAVIHDDLDLEFGQTKIQLGKGPKIHNGLLSLYHHLHTNSFWHVRMGVDSRAGDRSIPGRSYVLQALNPTELEKIAVTSQSLSQDLLTKLKSTL
jgi:PTH1 family peptidyl-tRNA hydrolase